MYTFLINTNTFWVRIWYRGVEQQSSFSECVRGHEGLCHWDSHTKYGLKFHCLASIGSSLLYYRQSESSSDLSQEEQDFWYGFETQQMCVVCRAYGKSTAQGRVSLRPNLHILMFLLWKLQFQRIYSFLSKTFMRMVVYWNTHLFLFPINFV